MGDNAVLTRSEPEALSASLQRRVRDFIAFYEQHAYLAYNLALRITCDAETASVAVQRAFLSQLDESPSGLLAGTVQAAVAEASPRPDTRAAGDAEARRLMDSAAELAPAERAALGLADLAQVGPDEVGKALGLPSDQAAKLLQRAREGFGAGLGLSAAEAQEEAEHWMWAAPPNDIWEELYPRFHTALETQLRRGHAEQTLVLRGEGVAAPAESGRHATRGPRKRGRRLRLGISRPGRRAWLGIALALLVLGGLGAQQILGSDSGSDLASYESEVASPPGVPAADEPGTSEDGVKPHKPLTAALLDKLRLRELRQLRAYSKRQADSSLPARQRRAAARRIASIERAARARLRAQRKREDALREREARERARRNAPAPPPAVTPRRTAPSPRTEQPDRQSSSPAGPPANQEEADQTCLLNQDTGQYICPQ